MFYGLKALNLRSKLFKLNLKLHLHLKSNLTLSLSFFFIESSCISVGKNRKLCTLTPCVT